MDIEAVGNLGRWNPWYEGLTLDDDRPYGDRASYALGAEWLKDCDMVEDWGTGGGYFRRFIGPKKFRGIDGSRTPFANVITDLTSYTSDTCGIFIRHVLEHNWGWNDILLNACVSARHRLFIALFTPPSHKIEQIGWSEELGVPDIAFPTRTLLSIIEGKGFTASSERFSSHTQYNEETVIRAERIHAT